MDILAGIASKLGELLVGATVKQARYLFCFNSIVKELEDKETNLKEAQDGINKKVEEERQIHRAIDIEKDVEKWLADVVKEMADVRNLKAEIDEKKSCFNGWCPNWGFRYWMGRKASKETRKLSDLQDRGKFSTVALPKPLPSDTEMPIPRFFSSFETTESACNQITEALKKDSKKMVGLHGLGGVGKTTLAKSVGNQLRQQKIFDKVGIATVSQDPDIIKVQGELAKSLGWALNEKDEKERADRLRLMFSESKSSKILVILDDVWKQLDLEKKLGIPVGGRDNCCKILLTTRKKSVCDSLGCDTQIQLSTLTPEEGLALLRKNAGIDVNDSTLNDVSKEVAGECKGLPLAIEAVGSALRGKGFNEWNLALHNLKAAKLYAIEGIDEENLDVYGCLKFSYDNLNDDNSKLCFLLCSLFPEDYEIDLEDLVGYAVGLTWYQAESIENTRSLLHGTIDGLKAASLLLDTGNDRSVKMHDIVRDVAIWISTEKKEKEERLFSINGIRLLEREVEKGLEQCKGISVMGNKEEELPSSLVCPNLHILRLENTVYNYELQIPEHFFKGMPALKVVTIIGGVLSLKSLQRLTNLQVLQLIRCKVSDASFLGKLKRLQILFLKNIGIIGCYNIVPSIDERGFNELTCLDVRDCEDLECIMEASKSPHGKSLSRLAELSMWDLPELKWIWKAPAQHVISLQTLTELNVHICNKLTYIFTLSQARSLKQLKSLNVSGCERLEYIVEAKFDHNEGEISVGDGSTMLALPLLRKLKLDDLPELTRFCSENYCSIWPALEKLCLEHCPNLTINNNELEANLQYLKENLNTLDVDNCSHLSDTIPALLKHGLKNLEELGIRRLGVQVVFQLEAIIAEGQENKLFPCLKRLWLENLRELQLLLYHEGPTHNFSLQSLTYLSVHRCTKPRRLFSSTFARNLLQLEELYVWNCFELEQIIDENEDEDEDHLQPVCFPKLTSIEVVNCPKLKHLFHISVAPSLQKLKDLYIIGNHELEEVFWHKDRANVTDYNEIVMNELRSLELRYLPNLTNFWPAGYQIPFPSAPDDGVVVRNCPKFRPSSEGEDDSENSGAETQQTTDEEDANEDTSEEKDDSEHK